MSISQKYGLNMLRFSRDFDVLFSFWGLLYKHGSCDHDKIDDDDDEAEITEFTGMF